MCGDAMLVPESSAQPPPETEDRTSTPGAETSGFRRSEMAVGPTDEKSACVRFADAADVHRADRDRVLGVRGRGDGAGSEVVVVVPGRDHGHDAGCCGRVEGERDDVPFRLDLGLTAREVDDVHPVRDGSLDRRHDRR